MIFRILIIITVGILLFTVLIYVCGYSEHRLLRKRKRDSRNASEEWKDKISIGYLMLLITVIAVCFLLIEIEI